MASGQKSKTKASSGTKPNQPMDEYIASLIGGPQSYAQLQAGAPGVQPGIQQAGYQPPGGMDAMFTRRPSALTGLPGVSTSQVGAPTVQGAQSATTQMNAAQGQMSPADLVRYEQSIYQSQFQPVNRELQRQADLNDRRMASQLASSGLASSGTGIGQRQQLAREFGQRQEGASSDAANRAAQMRYEQQFQMGREDVGRQQEANLQNARLGQEANLQNARMQQEARLATANFDQQAQITNAANLLQGNMAGAQNYLAAMGLDDQTANAIRQSFIQYTGIQVEDLQRMDQGNYQRWAESFNQYMKEWLALLESGKYDTRKSSASGGGVSLSQGSATTG